MRQTALVLIGLAPFLFGCAPYIPQTLGPPDNPIRFAQDMAWCQQMAQAWQPHPSASAVVQGGIDGAAQMFSYVVLDPSVPVAGAIGGAGNEMEKGFDVTGRSRANVLKNCLKEKTHRDQSAILADPGP